MAERKSWPTKELHSMQTPMRSRVYLFLCKIRLFLIDFDSQAKSATLSSRCTLTDLSLEVFYSLEDFSLAERRMKEEMKNNAGSGLEEFNRPQCAEVGILIAALCSFSITGKNPHNVDNTTCWYLLY